MDGAAERAEVRAFRPVLAWRLTRSPTQASSPTRPLARRLPLPLGQVLEWRAILEAHGFQDTLLYEVDPSPHPSPNPNPNPSPNPGPSPNPSPSPSPSPKQASSCTSTRWRRSRTTCEPRGDNQRQGGEG